MSAINEISDEQLVRDSANNVSGAIEELIGRYRSVVSSIVAKYNNAPLEKEDLIQEGLIGLLAAINSYQEGKGAKFSSYASRCINNSVQNALRKFSRLKDIPPSRIMPLEDAFCEDNPVLSAEDEYLAKESVSSLTEFLYEGLSRFENEVLRLYIQGYSYCEIADKLSKNQKAIDNAIQRIRKKLEGVTF